MLKLLLNSICIIIIALQCYAAENDIDKQLFQRNIIIEGLAKDMESLLINKIFQTLLINNDSNPLFGGSNAEKIYKDLLTEEYAKQIANGKGFGLRPNIIQDIQKGDSIYQNLKRMKNENQ